MDDQTRNPGTGTGAVSERVQALLSRAVEDQLVEQRAVSTSLTDLRNEVVAVAEAVRGGASTTAVEQLRGELADNASEARRASVQLSERLDALTRRVGEVDASVAAGERRILAHVDEAVLAVTESLLRPRPDRDELDRFIAESAAAGEAGPAGSEQDEPGAFDNDADAEVPVDAPAGGQDGPVQEPDADPDAEVKAEGETAVAEASQDAGGRPLAAVGAGDASDVDGETGRIRPGGRTGVTGGPAPRRARSTVPLPPIVPASETQDNGHDQEDDGRRRPWWRPGG